MEIINVTSHNTLWEEIGMLFIAGFLFLILIGFISMEYKNLNKFTKVCSWIGIVAMVGVMIYGVPNNLSRAYKYEIIEANVTDWNELMNDAEIQLIEHKDDWVKFKKKNSN